MSSRDARFLSDILKAIDRIQGYTTDGKEAFFASPLIQDAVVRNFEVMGEATKRLSKSIRSRYPDVQWRKMAGFRDTLIHEYDQVVLHIVWNTTASDLEPLKERIEAILAELTPNAD